MNMCFVWSDECTQAFQELKRRLIAPPIMAYPSVNSTFNLDCDASHSPAGAVLSQVQEGDERVIAYYSQMYSKAERNYCATRRELLAVVLAVKHFHHYLYGHPFLVQSVMVPCHGCSDFTTRKANLPAGWSS